MSLPLHYQEALKQYLLHDMPWGDVTTEDLSLRGHKSNIRIISKGEGILCGLMFAPYMMACGCESLQLHAKDGNSVSTGDVVLEGSGCTEELLGRERLTLNLLMRLSGVATLTRKFVDKAAPHNIKVCARRKTTPGCGTLEKYAVEMGGGLSHRMGLSDGYLIKNNHIAACGGVKATMDRIQQHRRHHLALSIEVRDLNELKTALDFAPQVVLCDHFSPEILQEAVTIVRHTNTKIEVSGNVTLENIEQYLVPGVSYISVGALTHKVSAVDFSMQFQS